LADDLEVGAVILDTHVLEHADRPDAVEAFVDVAVVLRAYFDGQAGA